MRKQCLGKIPIGIGQQSQLRKTIVDKNARIGNNVMVIVFIVLEYSTLVLIYFLLIFE